MLPAVQITVCVPQAVADALRARSLAEGHTVQQEIRLALIEHVGHARACGEMLHGDDIATGEAW